MASFSKFKRQLETAVKKVTKVDAWPATVVRAGTAPARSVVKFTNGLELEVLNYRFSSVADLKVSVGYDPLLPDVLQVLGIRESINLIGQASSWSFWLPEHHANHEFPNPDTVWVHGAQFVPLNVVPVSGLTVRIYGSVLRGDGEWVAFQTETLDLTSHQPATGALYALIELDETGAAVVTDGATKDSRFSLTAADIPEPTAGRTPICAIRLYDGQTKIYHDVRVGKPNDVTDLRWNRYANGGLADLAKDLDIANLPVEASPTSGDKLVIDRAGVRSQIDWDDLPAGGGGANWSDIDSATADTPLDADKFGFWDVVDAALKSITWANIKATLKSYFDTLYAAAADAYSDEKAQDAVGAMIADTATIDLTYTDATPELKADVKDNSIGVGKMTATATDKVFGRSSAGAGAGEEITMTAAGRALVDDADAAAQLVTLGATPTSGWIERSETWTRTGNYTFTISGDVTATYRKGTKIRYKDGGAFEYGVVISSSYSAPNTTITLATNDDYAMAAATITDKAISFVENPEAFPDWFNYANTIAGSASGSMTWTLTLVIVAKFKVQGATCKYNVFAIGTTGGTASNALRLSAPITWDGVSFVAATQVRDATSGVTRVGSGGCYSGGYLVAYKADPSSNYGLGTGRAMIQSGEFSF